jgi:ribosomal protein L11 methyltransferase
VGRHFVIRPTWEAYPAQADDLEIVLDPGQAFGTGDHPTTRLCLELLEDADLRDAEVCDVGCGSGILSIAACKLGAANVVAIDIEPVAVEVTKENAALNSVRFVAMVGEGIAPAIEEGQEGTSEAGATPEAAGFDVVIGNIISAILIRLARDVYAFTRPGSRWIVSGIISQNWNDVLEAAQRAGFELRTKREEDGWVAALFDRS